MGTNYTSRVPLVTHDAITYDAQAITRRSAEMLRQRLTLVFSVRRDYYPIKIDKTFGKSMNPTRRILYGLCWSDFSDAPERFAVLWGFKPRCERGAGDESHPRSSDA